MIGSRRQFLKILGASVAATALPTALASPVRAQGAPPAGPFTLPRLPYANDALTAAIDARTMEIHHDRHHAAYVAGLNAAVAGNAMLGAMPIEQILRDVARVPEAIRSRVINHGGGHYNHSLFWLSMAPNAGGEPAGALAPAINRAFTDFATFKRQFKEAALARFGSGWAWLVYDGNRLLITHTANQDCPLSAGQTPLLGLDVWEHAYYLRYQNRRADYIDAWWSVVNWDEIGRRFDRARA